MKKNFALACATFATVALMACSDDSNSSAVNPALDSYSSGVSDSDIYPPVDDPSQIDPSLDVPTLNYPTQNDPTLDDLILPGAVEPLDVPGSSADVAPASSSETAPISSESTPISSETVPASSATAPNSSADMLTSSSSIDAPIIESSSSEVPMSKIEGVYDYTLKNAPAPSRGCGKNSTLQKTGSVENGDRFEMSVAGLNREYFVTLPQNYDNTKPYKLLFAMHCMGSKAEDFVHHLPDQDHPSPYYGQQKLDTEGNYIFVAPRGDTDGMPWRGGDDKDHQFFDKLLTTMEDNYCIDTSRVFVTGFSFGSMFSNSLAQTFQHRIRAVVTYAVADFNIYIPQNAGKPIAWMDVHGIDDGLCRYKEDPSFPGQFLDHAIIRILKNNGPDGTDISDEINQMERYTKDKGATHVCYNFKKADPRYPVQVCTWGGGHQWTAFDNGDWRNTWVPDEVHKFFEQF